MKNSRKNPSSLLITGSFRLEVVDLPKLVAAALAAISLVVRMALLWLHHAA